MPINHSANNVRSWASIIEPDTLAQAERTAQMPFLTGPLALMPDAHLGKGATIGSVIPTKGAIIPAAVGVDLGCGVTAVRTDLFGQGLPDNLDKMLAWIGRVVPAGVGRGHENRRPMPPIVESKTGLTDNQRKKAANQFGSLGSGNHFVEICLDEEDRVWVMLHSGSRGIGNELASQHIEGAQKSMKEYLFDLSDLDLAFFVEGTPEFGAYLERPSSIGHYTRSVCWRAASRADHAAATQRLHSKMLK